MKRTVCGLILALLLTSMLALQSTERLVAIAAPRIYLEPSNNVFSMDVAMVGTTFNVSVLVENAPDLSGAQVYMEFNDSVVNVVRWFEPTWNSSYIFYGMPSSPAPAPPNPSYYHFGPGHARVMVGAVKKGNSPPWGHSGLICILELSIISVPSETSTKLASNLVIDSNNTFLLDPQVNEVLGVTKENGYYEVSVHAAKRVVNLIVTTTDLEAAATRLAQWKNSCGIVSEVLNVTWIYSHYNGVDEPEKIRNCIRAFYSSFRTEYVTILGDADKVPTRYVYLPDENEDTNFTATDLYYADLKGTWDDNHDGLFADQRYDYVNGIPDVCIGRIPVSFVENSQPIVDKIIRYQQQFDPSQNWTRRVVLAAGTGNNGIEDNQGTGFTVLNEFIANITSDKEIVKLYEKAGTLSTGSMSREINQGALFVNFAGHGDPGATPIFSAGWLFYWVFAPLIWNGFGIRDVRSTTNGAKLPVVTTCSCSTARFDDADCIGEWFVGHPTGGAIAYFGSTRISYGYANDSSPNGLMGEMDRRIYENFYGGFTRLGQMWREATREYVQFHVANYQYAGLCDAKTIMEFVLFGDPTLRIYNGPETLEVPDQYSTIQGAVNDAYDGDTVFVRNGTYYENVVINKTISLIGEDRDNTIVDGNWTGTVMQVTTNGVEIENLTIRNSGPHLPDSGVWIVSGHTNCTITGNYIANTWAGIALVGTANNTISKNVISNNTNGFFLWSAGQNRIFENNISHNNAAFAFDEASGNVIFHNNVVGNKRFFEVWTVDFPYISFLDDGYPSGGNYWSGIAMSDLYSGPNQNETGSDGIGDTAVDFGMFVGADHYPLMQPYPAHDVAVNTITAAPIMVCQGYGCSTAVTVVNKGDLAEVSNVTIYANFTATGNVTAIATFENVALNSRESKLMLFMWNTSGFDLGDYTISAVAEPVSGELALADNTFVGNTVQIIQSSGGGGGRMPYMN